MRTAAALRPLAVAITVDQDTLSRSEVGLLMQRLPGGERHDRSCVLVDRDLLDTDTVGLRGASPEPHYRVGPVRRWWTHAPTDGGGR